MNNSSACTEQVPATIQSIEQLEDMLSAPDTDTVESLSKLNGDIMILGAGGKIGPGLARMAKRASDAGGSARRVIAVDRFRSQENMDYLLGHNIEAIRCDLLDRKQISDLPDAQNIVFMLGKKFGSSGEESLTWAVNTYAPALICERFRYSRIVAFSSGNIYGLTNIKGGGSLESDTPNPVGDYAMSALGRERIFQYFSQSSGTPVAILRLNYAVEMRYGVLVDIASKVWADETVDVCMGNANVIWQGDVNAVTLRAFGIASSPAMLLNLTGPEVVSIRRVAEQFGSLMNRAVKIEGLEAEDVLLNDAQLCHRLYGYPKVSLQQMILWIADWVMKGGPSFGKPTHFETRNGKY